MGELLEKAEIALLELTQKHITNQNEHRATIHQWINAIAYDHELYAAEAGVTKDDVIKVLTKNNLYKTRSAFRKKLAQETNITPKNKTTFTFIDLFAGIGGMRLGFQEHGGLCVFSSEYEKNAQDTYLQNHGEIPFGDITEIAAEDIPEHDVLIAGFPCQPFSHAGLKLGIEDTRGTLFYDIARIMQAKRPKFALLENVRGLISHEKGATLKVILKTLTDIGYKCNISAEIIRNGSAKEIQEEAKKMVLRSTDFGVPQNRQRIYIILWRDIAISKFNYPTPSMLPTRVGDILEESSQVSKKYTISNKLWAGHKRRKRENKLNGKGFGYSLVNEESPYTNTISARYYKDGSEVLIDQKNLNPRKITPREAANLQGFPHNFILSASDVQAYKQFGNSVTVPVISALAKEIKKPLEDA
ncbi:DNA cytosine methyltransferase [Chlorobium phaeovibrioides]|uniref:Cytosine-specific methyltransferase n=1 Tax=Chlorobium phaeovibrioides TaxID=1094 RepID=A0A3S0N982_CHLPH|nr:DNA cytosine methyltransferase [Chlorobium phaeovibrioides]RTY35392.1 DNA cytosine methyltransferase [Chlorobium phaeovibrioides]